MILYKLTYTVKTGDDTQEQRTRWFRSKVIAKAYRAAAYRNGNVVGKRGSQEVEKVLIRLNKTDVIDLLNADK